MAQLRISGTERKDVNPQIEKAAKAYKTVRDERMELTETESKKKAALMAAMNEAKLNRYICDFDEQEVIVEPGEANVKIKTRKPPPAPEDSSRK